MRTDLSRISSVLYNTAFPNSLGMSLYPFTHNGIHKPSGKNQEILCLILCGNLVVEVEVAEPWESQGERVCVCEWVEDTGKVLVTVYDVWGRPSVRVITPAL